MALALANARFWPTVAPLASGQLKRWERCARLIEDPVLQSLALEKLREERFNAEVAATLATLTPKKHRQAVVEAIVAYEVMYDYLDGLTEQPTADPLHDGHELYRAFTEAITPSSKTNDDYYASRPVHDGGYLKELVDVVQGVLVRLPSTAVIAPAARRAAARCAEAQIRAHAAPTLGTLQLEQWAASEAVGTPLGWEEFLAGAASSVLAVHALIAAAADESTTPEDAAEIDTTYLSICALSTMLDSLVDYQRDMRAGQAGYIRYYKDHDHLSRDLTGAVHRAVEHAAPLRNGPHHVMTLVGVAAYYISAPTAGSDFARPVTRQVRRELKPLITPTLAVMRAWRAAKRAREAIPRKGRPLMGTPAAEAHNDPDCQVARYVAIITDGNGRWARSRGAPVNDGHEAGADTLKARLRDAVELGIQELTVYSFSTENWSRPAGEVRGLIAMLAQRIARETPELHREGVRMRFIGRREKVSSQLVEQMRRAEALTAGNQRLTLFIAFNYGGRAEILDAAKRFHGSTEEEFRRCLYVPEMHDPDVIIRTGNERRLSNYLLWQAAYSELVFRDELWPDFTRQSLVESLAEFSERRRRFGGR